MHFQAICVYSVDAGGKFQVEGDRLIRVGFETDPETTQLSWPFTLLFRSSGGVPSSDHLHCFKWDSGGWMAGECWYLGRHNDAEVCQCTSAGVYGLFRKRRVDSVRSAFYVSDYVSIALSVLAVCGLSGSVQVARSRRSDHCVAVVLLLQMAVAWMVILMSCVARRLVGGVVCFSLSILFHYFMMASLLLMIALVMEEHVRINRDGSSGKSFLLKASLSVWGAASLVFAATAINRWKSLVQNEECWIVDSNEFWIMLAPIGVLSLLSFTLQARNYHKRRILTDFEFTLKDFCQLMHMLLMPVTAVSAVLNNSYDHHSLVTSAFFCVASSLWCVSLVISSRPESVRPEASKSFNPNRGF